MSLENTIGTVRGISSGSSWLTCTEMNWKKWDVWDSGSTENLQARFMQYSQEIWFSFTASWVGIFPLQMAPKKPKLI